MNGTEKNDNNPKKKHEWSMLSRRQGGREGDKENGACGGGMLV